MEMRVFVPVFLAIFQNTVCLGSFCPNGSIIMQDDNRAWCIWILDDDEPAVNSRHLCNEDESSMFTIEDSTIQSYLETTLAPMLLNISVEMLWINYNATEKKTFEGKPISYSNWHSTSLTANDECVVIPVGTGIYTWFRTNCNSLATGLCYKEIECPPDSVIVLDYDLVFWISNILEDAFSSQEICAENGGALAVIPNEAVNDILMESSTFLQLGSTILWIGINDICEEDRYVTWDGKDAPFLNFRMDQPNDFGPPFPQDCVIAIVDDYLQWQDKSCDYLYKAICSKAIGTKSSPVVNITCNTTATSSVPPIATSSLSTSSATVVSSISTEVTSSVQTPFMTSTPTSVTSSILAEVTSSTPTLVISSTPVVMTSLISTQVPLGVTTATTAIGASTTGSNVTLDCPPYSLYVALQSKFGCFWINTTSDTAQDGNTNCQLDGGDLAVIYNDRTNTLLQYAYTSYRTLGYNLNDGVWIGVTDTDSEGIYKSWKGGNITYTNWAQGQPSSLSGYNCVSVLPNNNSQWQTNPCNDQKAAFCAKYVHNPYEQPEEYCSCDSQYQAQNYTDAALLEKLDELRKEMLVDTKNTSAYRRTLICVSDPRPSAQVMGVASAIFLTTVGVIIVLPDLVTAVQAIYVYVVKLVK